MAGCFKKKCICINKQVSLSGHKKCLSLPKNVPLTAYIFDTEHWTLLALLIALPCEPFSFDSEPTISELHRAAGDLSAGATKSVWREAEAGSKTQQRERKIDSESEENIFFKAQIQFNYDLIDWMRTTTKMPHDWSADEGKWLGMN